MNTEQVLVLLRVTRVIKQETMLITPIKAPIAILSKSHDLPSISPKP